MKKILFILLISLAACNTTTRLHHSGRYVIETRNGNVTTFFGVKGKYIVPSDTLKAGDTVMMIEVTPLKNAQ